MKERCKKELIELIHDVRDLVLCMEYPCRKERKDECDRIRVRLLSRLVEADKVVKELMKDD